MMTEIDKKRIAEILQDALDAATASIGARLKLFLDIGKAIMAVGNVIRQPAPKGNRLGVVVNGIGYSAAIRTVKNHLIAMEQEYGYELPRCDRYWFASLHCFAEYSEAEKQTLLKKNIAWAKVCDILAEPDKGHGIIADLKSGAALPTRREFRRRSRNRSRRNLGIIDVGFDPKVVAIPLPRMPDDEEFQMAIKSLVSQVAQSHLLLAVNKAVMELKRNRFGEPLAPWTARTVAQEEEE